MKDFLTFARERYSVRKFSDKPVEQEKIEKLLMAAALAPTARNSQPQRIYVVQSAEKRAALSTVTPCIFDAPVIIVIGYDDEWVVAGKICEGFNFGDIDTSIVCTHVMLEAHDLGLGSCWVGSFNEAQASEALGLPAGVHIRELLPVGYPAEDAAPAPMHEKSRSLNDMVQYL